MTRLNERLANKIIKAHAARECACAFGGLCFGNEARGWLQAHTAAQEREAKLQAEIADLRDEYARWRAEFGQNATKIMDENANLKAKIEGLEMLNERLGERLQKEIDRSDAYLKMRSEAYQRLEAENAKLRGLVERLRNELTDCEVYLRNAYAMDKYEADKARADLIARFLAESADALGGK